MECLPQFYKLCHIETRRWLLLVGVVAVTYLLFQSLLLPYGDALRSLLPDDEAQFLDENSLQTVRSSTKSAMVRNPLTVRAVDFTNTSMLLGLVKDTGYLVGQGIQHDQKLNWNDKDAQNVLASKKEGPKKVVTVYDNMEALSIVNQETNYTSDKDGEDSNWFHLEQIVKPSNDTFTGNDLAGFNSLVSQKIEGGDTAYQSPSNMFHAPALVINVTNSENLESNKNISLGSFPLQNDLTTSENATRVETTLGKKKMRCDMPPKSITSIDEMNHILMRHRTSSRSMRPRWSSIRDREVFAAKSQIEHAPAAINDPELYAPLFRNVSMFKRSYELMERTLKVYIYKEGKKPIFHLPILKGLYASEGWFMKLMEGNKQYVVKDPRRAHLFYMPFSSRMLEHSLYVRNSHNRTNLRQYLKVYTEKIAAKYPYFNRTGGADHFLVACHDWAPYETRHHMERCIKALCNADVTTGFKIGRDVSLPETYVRSARNPLRDLGGKPPSQRRILAFYAGNLHGYLRPILLRYWKDKDPKMKILGPMPTGVASKMNYIQHMKSSKYCICPKGYEVNSPRVVESIFYECVPVIISDNFVPPFFEILDWGSFSVIVAEKDIPRLKEILLSIPEERYLEMQLRIRKVQRHFLWHAKPLKYDLFHMTLHSIWYNRVFQIKLR